ncbi:hypothetical protein DSO57_1000477 [Entomophthora muscae]|uniref:Uncharacterized protein n=1 Tax=Entomophthora muscae TaxID=34485 RepID=A0ACC2UVV6_9FUNG|nr:hypothetical protein DSO57_1000477 [Entomophthora muscae]
MGWFIIIHSRVEITSRGKRLLGAKRESNLARSYDYEIGTLSKAREELFRISSVKSKHMEFTNQCDAKGLNRKASCQIESSKKIKRFKGRLSRRYSEHAIPLAREKDCDQ